MQISSTLNLPGNETFALREAKDGMSHIIVLKVLVKRATDNEWEQNIEILRECLNKVVENRLHYSFVMDLSMLEDLPLKYAWEIHSIISDKKLTTHCLQSTSVITTSTLIMGIGNTIMNIFPPVKPIQFFEKYDENVLQFIRNSRTAETIVDVSNAPHS